MNDKIINEELILKPLESIVTVKEDDFKYLEASINRKIKIELYCPICKKNRVFSCDDAEVLHDYSRRSFRTIMLDDSPDILVYTFACEYHHQFKVIFETIGGGELIKIGQFPSPTYLSQRINNTIFNELNKEEKEYYLLAIKARDNNLNIASFVYLRRVFESLIKKATDNSKSDFNNKTMKDKIKILVKEGLINEMLLDTGYNVLYPLLSDGVHNLSESMCEELFDLLKNSIEIILEDKIYKDKLEKRKKAIGNLLSNKNSEKESVKNK